MKAPPVSGCAAPGDFFLTFVASYDSTRWLLPVSLTRGAAARARHKLHLRLARPLNGVPRLRHTTSFLICTIAIGVGGADACVPLLFTNSAGAVA
jgi:hypothetical protein